MNNVIATPPGATIKEQLEDRRMPPKFFMRRMGLSRVQTAELLEGKMEITPEIAARLECTLGVPAHFWDALERIYRDKLAAGGKDSTYQTGGIL